VVNGKEDESDNEENFNDAEMIKVLGLLIFS